MDVPPMIVSYPRSGSNFFARQFKAKTGVGLSISHAITYGVPAFSCVRGPLESLASSVAMGLETIKHKTIASVGQQYYENQGQPFNEDSLDGGLDYNINQYELFYSYLNSSNNAIVDYETYKLDIDSSIAQAAGFFNIDLLSDPMPAEQGEDNPRNGYLVSSKVSEFYDRALEFVAKKDLTKATALYGKCLEKSILS